VAHSQSTPLYGAMRGRVFHRVASGRPETTGTLVRRADLSSVRHRKSINGPPRTKEHLAINHALAEPGSFAIFLMTSHGYLGLAVLMFLGGMFVPVPAEIVLPLVGFLVFRGELSFAAAVAAATAGSVGAALAVYAVGYRLGEEALRRLVRRFGRYLLVGERDLDRMLGHFERHGGTSVLVGRLVPGAGSLVSVPAGLARMPISRYLACTTVGCAAWNLAHIGLGWALGTRWHLVSEQASMLQYAVAAAMAAGVLWYLWRIARRPETEGTTDDPGSLRPGKTPS
jgi:membrane protein DedA with SNARE-associated domain